MGSGALLLLRSQCAKFTPHAAGLVVFGSPYISTASHSIPERRGESMRNCRHKFEFVDVFRRGGIPSAKLVLMLCGNIRSGTVNLEMIDYGDEIVSHLN